jgi:hypothetical protein
MDAAAADEDNNNNNNNNNEEKENNKNCRSTNFYIPFHTVPQYYLIFTF